ncbi:hypothetical protein, partial [Streptomyces europaeiscabiei]|uniref:hypothetical protein n=1 Tax=Streptomyces europaeiscabiei TaxID=146819 RepID=UPI0029B8A027
GPRPTPHPAHPLNDPTDQTDTPPANEPDQALLVDAPLLDLLAQLDVTLDESSITDPEFTGAAVVTRDGVVLSMRSGQPDWERDAVARVLLSRVHNVPLSPLPEPYRITEV